MKPRVFRARCGCWAMRSGVFEIHSRTWRGAIRQADIMRRRLRSAWS